LGPFSENQFQAHFNLTFLPDYAAFKKANNTTCNVKFIQIARVNNNGSTLGKGKTLGLIPTAIPQNMWFIDSDQLPYYPYQTGQSVKASPSMHDEPGFTSQLWKVQDVSYEFEDAVVDPKSGEVYGCVQWGFSYFVRGPAWNRQPVARTFYLNNLVWTDAEQKTIWVPTMFGVGRTGEIAPITIGGPSMKPFRGVVDVRQPSEEMKKVLSKYFPPK
jgi:hypothetical protein